MNMILLQNIKILYYDKVKKFKKYKFTVDKNKIPKI